MYRKYYIFFNRLVVYIFKLKYWGNCNKLVIFFVFIEYFVIKKNVKNNIMVVSKYYKILCGIFKENL